jgi:hypothetical protein|tara:strand:- start:132 stop:407 length:276 start_codon:yes stop_codon:yes gene_type:complete
MTLTKNIIVDKAETVKVQDHYCIQVREKNQIMEDGNEISASFHRYVLPPDYDVSKINDATVKAQFQAVMTDSVKANYTAFLEAQEAKLNPE